MAKARSTFGKLQRDQAKRDKAAAKQQDRQARREAAPDADKAPEPSTAEDQEALLAQFALLHEDLADGRISLEEFEIRQEDLRSRLVVD